MGVHEPLSPRHGNDVTGFDIRPLDETTWPDFARLVERHNGVWGGCWCMSFHAEGVGAHRPLGKHHWVVTKVV